MSEKPNINIRRFEPKKISAKYWVRFLLYGLILGGLLFWYKSKNRNSKSDKIEHKELNFKEFEIED